MFIGMAGRQEAQENLVVPAEIGLDDIEAAFDIAQDRTMMLAHAARRAASAAGVDDAGQVVALGIDGQRLRRGLGDQIGIKREADIAGLTDAQRFEPDHGAAG